LRLHAAQPGRGRDLRFDDHDLDILLALVGEPVTEVKAVGIPVLSDKVDIAHARLEFAGGAVANVTASRVSTERVRKVRFFQQHEYISLDYARRDALRVAVKRPGPEPEFAFEKLPAAGVEPLRAELEAFLDAVRTRREPKTNGTAGRAALELATRVMACIQEHAARVQPSGSHPGRICLRFTIREKTRNDPTVTSTVRCSTIHAGAYLAAAPPPRWTTGLWCR